MKVITLRSAVAEVLNTRRHAGFSVGFVPTMGALHEGHLSLVKRAKTENDLAVVSIFVNPIQFNNPSDLEKYPRDLNRDLDLLSPLLSDHDLVFAPTVEEMYPVADERTFAFGDMGSVMEGAFRPGHFNGVAIVVDRLFSMVGRCKGYFGEKDFQQLAIIRRLVEEELHFFGPPLKPEREHRTKFWAISQA